jgi:hypothetical protein
MTLSDDAAIPADAADELTWDSQFAILIECDDETQQTKYLTFLQEHDIKCRALVS